MPPCIVFWFSARLEFFCSLSLRVSEWDEVMFMHGVWWGASSRFSLVFFFRYVVCDSPNKILLRACNIGVFMRVNGRKGRPNEYVFHLPQFQLKNLPSLPMTKIKNTLTKNLQFYCWYLLLKNRGSTASNQTTRRRNWCVTVKILNQVGVFC